MMRNGVVFERQMQGRLTLDSASSFSPLEEAGLLRTPTASEVAGGMMDPAKAKAEGRTVRLSSQMVELANPGQLLPTPLANDEKTWSYNIARKGQSANSLSSLARQGRLGANLLPTPTCNDANNASNPPSQHNRNTPPLAAITAYFPSGALLGTPRASEGMTRDMRNPENIKDGEAKGRLEDQITQLLPTPNTMDMLPAREGEAMERQLRRGKGEGAPRRSTMGNLREDILQTVDPEAFAPKLLPTPKAADGLMHTPTTSGRPVEKSTHLGTIAMLQGGHLEHRRDVANLPTPRATDGTNGGPNQRGSKGDPTLPSAVHAPNWGKYEPAIRRWEKVNGEAPAPTEPNTKGKHRLSARFAEWLMGLPPGWVTGETPEQHKARIRQRMEGQDKMPIGMRGSLRQWDPGISRNDQLKAIGNGVVPQQAILALLDMKKATLSGGL